VLDQSYPLIYEYDPFYICPRTLTFKIKNISNEPNKQKQ